MGKRIFGLIVLVYMVVMGYMVINMYQDYEMLRIYSEALELELPD